MRGLVERLIQHEGLGREADTARGVGSRGYTARGEQHSNRALTNA